MNDFVLLGHDNPIGKYPAPVIPVGQLNGDLVAIYPGGPTGAVPEQVNGDCLYVSYQDALRRRLKEFNYRTDRLFAYQENDVVFFPVEHEKDFLKDFLLHSRSDREHSFLRLLLAKQTGDLALIVGEMGFCSQILLEETPSFAQRWCANELVEIYPQIDPRRFGRDKEVDRSSATGEAKPLILVADDDHAIVEAYKRYLEDAGYAVSVAYDGDEALEKVRRERPRLIILDIVMPKKSGVEVLEELRRDPSSKEIPVIVMTGGPLDVGTVVGANMYLQKGDYNLAQLREYAEGFLANKKVG